MSLLQNYIKDVKNCLDEIVRQNIEEIADTIFKAYQKGKQIFIIGNGGSASTASHFVCDLSLQTAIESKPRVKVIGLTDNMAVITARANDIGYESIFKEQLITYLNKGDIVIGISASGNSPNILSAIEYAHKKGAITIGFCGFGGGKLKEITDKNIILSSNNYGQVEDSHLILAHIVSYITREKIKNQA